ncbi:MAG: hypothetical protein WDM76_12190 [Limisphaerales bacterium]
MKKTRGNLLKAVETELHNRRKGDAVSIGKLITNAPEQIRAALLKTFRLSEDDLYLVNGPLNPTRLMALYQGDHSHGIARCAIRRANCTRAGRPRRFICRDP